MSNLNFGRKTTSSVQDDDLNATYLSKEKKLIKERFSRIEEINDRIKEICIKTSLNTEACGFDQQKYESIKFLQGITKRLSVLSQTLSTNENAPSSNSRRNLSKKQTLLMLPKLECIKFSEVKPSKSELKNFLAQFQNCVMHLKSNEVKLKLLKSYLSDCLTTNITFDIRKL